jgi:hypothetical protein
MSATTVPFLALAVLISLSLSARPAARVAAGCQIAAAALSFGVLISLLIFS